MSIQEWGLIVSLLGNVILVIGWIYNHNRNEKLEKELVDIKRRYEKIDRELKEFRDRLPIVGDIIETMLEFGHLALEISNRIRAEDFDNEVAQIDLAKLERLQQKLRIKVLIPEYQSLIRLIPKKGKEEFMEIYSSAIAKPLIEVGAETSSEEVANRFSEIAEGIYELSRYFSTIFAELDRQFSEE